MNLRSAIYSRRTRAAHIGIADWLVKWNLEPKPVASSKLNHTFQKVAKYFSPEYHENLLALIGELDLEVWF